jgi:phospholipase C
MQENRSFDSYFGTFPGADGFPTTHGRLAPCVPDPRSHGCVRPFHDLADRNADAPHSAAAAVRDIDAGRMDGFINQAERAQPRCSLIGGQGCAKEQTPGVMGYHDGRDLPNYWAWAHQFVLQDHLFEPNRSWSLPQHLFMVSEWSAVCAHHNPMSCTNALQNPALPNAKKPPYAWTDLTYLLHRQSVSWRYYVQSGSQPDCTDDSVDCPPVHQNARTESIWNPLPGFDTVHQNHQLTNITDVTNYYRAARTGDLPAVSWITPSLANSEHAPARLSDGQTWVTSLVNAAMKGPDWGSTAIFVSWDDWGGLYDHVAPPVVDHHGFGLRVPGLLISPYARRHYIDHQVMSQDAYVTLIEDLFLGGRRLDPRTDGRPDSRPFVRDEEAVGNAFAEFDFHQRPQAPMPLDLHPRTDLRP